MKTRIFLLLITLLFFKSSVWADQITDELKNKGLKTDMLETLNPTCKEALNFDFKKDTIFWNALFNRKERGVNIDFLIGTKHYSLTLIPRENGSCQVTRAITSYWTVKCSKLAERYKKQFPGGKVNVKGQGDIFMWLSSGRGTDIYLYKVPSGCVEIFREFYLKPAPPKAK